MSSDKESSADNAPSENSSDHSFPVDAAPEELRDRLDAQQYPGRLTEILADESRSPSEKLRALLQVGAEWFGVENGHLVRIDPAQGTHRIEEVSGPHPVVSKGAEADLSGTYCRMVLADGGVLALGKASEQGWEGDPAYEAYELETYLGTKVLVGEELYGTVCFVDQSPREAPPAESDAAALALLAQAVGQALGRRRRADRLERTTARLEALFEDSPDMINIHDTEGNLILPNPRLREKTGYDEEELTRMKVWDLDRSVDPEAARALWAEMEPGDRRRLEGTYARKDGTTFPVETDLRCLDLDGADRFVATARDITERKEREQKLRDAQERMELALQHTDSIVFEIDLETRAVTRHGSFEDVFDASPEELSTWDAFAERAVHPADREKFRTFYRRLEEGERESGTLEYRTSPETGAIRWIRANVIAKEPDGHRRVRGLAQDITDRREAQEALRESEERFRGVFENAAIGIAIVGDDGRVIESNPALEAMAGHGDEGLQGRHFTELTHPDDIDKDEALFEELVAEERDRYQIEKRYLRKSGEVFWGRLTVSRLGKKQIIGMVEDIDERKRQERELREAKEEAEEANRLKSAMMANMSHEIRTPLTSITGFADLLKTEVEGNAVDFAERIRRSGERLMQTMDAVLELSRLEAGVSDLEREAVDLAEVAEATAERLRPEADEASVGLQVERPADPIQGLWNEGALTQITEALLENAIKFTPEGGRAVVRVRDAGDAAILEVEDTGIGIGEAAQTEIFEAFQQESEGLDREYEGTGLGLSIAQRLTDALGGTIEVESEKGEGSRFVVRLPPKEQGTVERPSDAGEATSRPPAAGAPRTEAAPGRSAADEQASAEEATGPATGEGAVFHRMYQITADPEATFDEKTARLIELGIDYLGLPHGHLTRISEGTQEILTTSGNHPLIQAGATCPLSEAYCRKTIEEESLLAIQDAPAEGWANDPAYKKFGLGAYIGAKVVTNGNVYGTFCFAATEPRARPFSPREKAFVELLARWTSYEIERRRAEQRLERQNERLEQFSGALTHDLRNPLNVAQGRLSIALDEMTGDADPAASGESAAVLDHLRAARRALGRMETLIEDMLALTWGEQELTAEDLEAVSLQDVAENSWAQVDAPAATLHVTGDLTLHAHEGRLRQLLENLFRNAIEHGGEAVTVTVRPLPAEEGRVGFCVEDDGPGIPEEAQEKVFERGYSSDEEGTGLGLSIVASIAEAHGGTVTVESEKGEGCCFTVQLPTSDANPTASTPSSA